MTFLYRLLIRLSLPLIFVYLWWRGRRAAEYRQRWRERLALQKMPAGSQGGIVIHCASVGETVAAKGLIQRLLNEFPQLPVITTTMTPTGSALISSLFGEQVYHSYLPFDTPGSMQRWFRKLEPKIVLVLETELWPCLLAEANRRHVPVLLMNARLSERSLNSYRKYHWLLGDIWSKLSFVCAQTEATRERFVALGVADKNIAVSGNLKLDMQVPTQLIHQAQKLRQSWQRPVLVAGSTHVGEDEIVLDAFAEVLQEVPDALLIIVPRHPERFSEVTQLAAQQFSVVQRSGGEPVSRQHQVLMGDTMGELSLWYAAADAAFIGGSLIERGGHNPLEAVAVDTPVLSGPHRFNFEEVFARLAANSALQTVNSVSSLASSWLALLREPEQAKAQAARAQRTFAGDAGATERMTETVRRHLPFITKDASMIEKHQADGCELWFDPDYMTNMTMDMLSPGYWQQRDRVTGQASGRNTAWFLQLGEQGALLRHYYRGGMVGKVNRDRFANEPVERSRAMAEFSLLLQLRAMGLAVPRPIAAKYQAAPVWGYRADILVEVIPGAQDVFHTLSERAILPDLWRRIGRCIREFHDHGVYHSDLNCHNIMLDAEAKVWLVDFDKCEIRESGDWREKNLERLQRSLRKELAKAEQSGASFHWHDSDWPHLLAGYHASEQGGSK